MRQIVAIVCALLLAVVVVRNASARAWATLRPDLAAKVWAGHPSVELSRGLVEIGTASKARRPINPATFALIEDAAARSPLSPEPFLVRGVAEQNAGRTEAAKEAFLAAQWRDPRSLPAAFFLADYFYRSGNPFEGLQQTALLARLSPNGNGSVAPYVAAYTADRRNWPRIRAVFRTQPALEEHVLAILAQDARNTDAIIAVADEAHRKPDAPWLTVLLSKLVANGEYARARSLWSSTGGGASDGSLIFDAGFSKPGPPPPFNWALASSNIGLAERESGGRLHVIFYGNVDGVLAGQLILLGPGRYRLSSQLAGAPLNAGAVNWTIRCNNVGEPFSTANVADVASHGWTFDVPANCPAQWLELVGRSGDVSQQAEVTIGALQLAKAN